MCGVQACPVYACYFKQVKVLRTSWIGLDLLVLGFFVGFFFGWLVGFLFVCLFLPDKQKLYSVLLPFLGRTCLRG